LSPSPVSHLLVVVAAAGLVLIREVCQHGVEVGRETVADASCA
jgi:hypothetical protein